MQTRIYKERDGWKAKTEIPLPDGKVLTFGTYKGIRGRLVTRASVWNITANGFLTHSMCADYASEVVISNPPRVTEGVVEQQRHAALRQLELIKHQAIEHYKDLSSK